MRQGDRQSNATRLFAAAAMTAAVAGAANSARATLTLDVRASATQDNPSAVQVSPDGKSVTIKSTSPGSIKLDIFAVVTGNTTGTTEGFGAMFAAFDLNAGTAATPTKGALSATVQPTIKDGQGNVTQVGYDAYPDATVRNGTAYVDANGFGHVGRDPSTLQAGQSASDTATGWFFAAYQNTNILNGTVQAINTDGTPLPGDTGKEFKIGTLTFTPNTASIANGTNTATLSATRRTRTAPAVVPAIWLEDQTNVMQVPFDTIPGGTFNVGSAVTFNVSLGSVVFAGDVNGDHIVNQTDLSTIVLNWQKTGQTRDAGDLSGDGIVNQTDLSEVVLNWQKTYPASAPTMAEALAMVPEPSALGVVALGSLALVKRRRNRA